MILAGNCFSQPDDSYNPTLVVPGKTWVFLIAGDYPNPGIYADTRYKIGNDTLVGGTNYKILQMAYGSDKYTQIRGFIRENADGKIYFRNNSIHEEEEFLLYDFGITWD